MVDDANLWDKCSSSNPLTVEMMFGFFVKQVTFLFVRFRSLRINGG